MRWCGNIPRSTKHLTNAPKNIWMIKKPDTSFIRQGLSESEFSRRLEEVILPVYQSAKNMGFSNWNLKVWGYVWVLWNQCKAVCGSNLFCRYVRTISKIPSFAERRRNDSGYRKRQRSYILIFSIICQISSLMASGPVPHFFIYKEKKFLTFLERSTGFYMIMESYIFLEKMAFLQEKQMMDAIFWSLQSSWQKTFWWQMSEWSWNSCGIQKMWAEEKISDGWTWYLNWW